MTEVKLLHKSIVILNFCNKVWCLRLGSGRWGNTRNQGDKRESSKELKAAIAGFQFLSIITCRGPC